jgi:hypothetical protein
MTPDPSQAQSLRDARQQTHHAAQFATAAGISYLPHEADDSHTNLEWLEAQGALASHVVPGPHPFRIALRIANLSVLILDEHDTPIASLELHGHTIADAAQWIRARVSERGLDGRRYTTSRHFVIPPHPVGDGAAFDASNRRAFEELSGWFACAADELGRLRKASGGSSVRCWPHHFDIATLIQPAPGQSIGVGLEPGDVYYDEPYFYVNMYPAPPASALTAQLGGGGAWHTDEWIGAVLPGSRIAGGDAVQPQIRAFLESAVATARSLLGASTTAAAR